MIKNIIFDIGNVLVTFDPITYFQAYFEEDTNAFLCKEVFTSETWAKVDQGILCEHEAKDYFLKKYPTYANDLKVLFAQWKGLMVEKTDTLEFLKDLKQKGYSVYALSNIGEESYTYCVQHFQFFQFLTGGVYSYQEKIVKPNKQIYTCLLERYKLLPGECIFMDDATKNVKQAREMGIHAVQFQTCAQAKKQVLQIMKEEAYVEN